MKRKAAIMLLAAVCLLTLSACGCKHETWLDANCTTAKTCADCGEAEGAPLGHSWLAATCETAKTCEVCGETEGEALGHSWTDAACEAAKTCEACGETEGEALGHSWQDATTEAPKTCVTCSATDGERIITDERFTTEATADIQGKWSCEIPMTGEMMELDDFEGELKCLLIMELGNDGTMTMSFAPADEAEFNATMTQYLTDTLYAELAASGLSEADADAAMQATYGMTVPEYAASAMEEMDISSLFDAMQINAVYYAEDNQLYVGLSWNAAMNPTPFTLEGDTLTMEGDISGNGAETSIFTRVTE